jgi:hypothetical protein
MTHAKDRSHRMLCNGCSPFDSSSTSTFVNLWTLCPSCSGLTDARDGIAVPFAKRSFSMKLPATAAMAITTLLMMI